MTTEFAERMAVVESADSWTRTRWHHRARIKWESPQQRGGVDCALLLMETHVEAGLIERFEPENYPSDWARHNDEERFLAVLERYAKRIGEDQRPLREREPSFHVLPGNILIFKWDRTFSHGAVVRLFPEIVHASLPARSVVRESLAGHPLAEKPMRVYSYWGC